MPPVSHPRSSSSRRCAVVALVALACSSRDVSLGDDERSVAAPSSAEPPAEVPSAAPQPSSNAGAAGSATDLSLDVDSPLPDPTPPARCAPQDRGRCLPVGAYCWGNVDTGASSTCGEGAVCCVTKVNGPPGGSSSADLGGYGGE